MQVAEEKRHWEEFAAQDPFWAVLSYPDQKRGRWDKDEFYASGEAVIDEVLGHAAQFAQPTGHESALDFGCGLGRLTRALAGRFDRAVGVDISETMVANATELNEEVGNLSFQVNARTDLKTFDDATFDMVNTRIVLQHLPSRQAVEGYLEEFLRVLRPGGLLVFQMPSKLPLRVSVQPRRKAYLALRRLGFSQRSLYWRFGLHPNRMIAIPKPLVVEFLESHGAEVLDVVTRPDADLDMFEESVYYVTRP
jgi:SAM-dependent methyltransferase